MAAVASQSAPPETHYRVDTAVPVLGIAISIDITSMFPDLVFAVCSNVQPVSIKHWNNIMSVESNK